jgi:hypothetical protein
MNNVDKKSIIANRIFYSVLIILILGSVVVTFIKIVVNKDYQIVAETSCDPYTESCYVYVCDPDTDKECTGSEEERTSYYKIVSKKAANIEICEATVDKLGCTEELSCIEGEGSCSYILCDPNNLAIGESCSTLPNKE